MTREEQAKAVVMRYVNEVWNDHDLDAIDDIFAASFRHLGGTAGESVPGRDAIRPFYEEFLGAFPDARAEVQIQIADGDRVATFKTISGTHRGEIHGIAPTGKRFEVYIADLFRVEDGKIVESWALLDEAALLRQIGVDVPGWV